MGLTGKGCGYVLRLRGQTRTAAALRLLREAALRPRRCLSAGMTGIVR